MSASGLQEGTQVKGKRHVRFAEVNCAVLLLNDEAQGDPWLRDLASFWEADLV